MKKHVICISAVILILQTVCVSLIHTTENDLTAKICSVAIFFITIAGILFFSQSALKIGNATF